jgi:hypothetical protein
MGTVTKNRLSAMGDRTSEPIVEEVLRFEDLPSDRPEPAMRLCAGATGPKVRHWPGTQGEILVCEGDHGNSRFMALGSRSLRR